MNLQKQLLEMAETLLRNTGMEDKTICYMLRAVHIFFPLLAACFIFFGSKQLLKLTVLCNIIVFILFLIFKGCILSKLERRFCQDDFTIIDPIISLLGLSLKDEVRVEYSFFLNILCILGAVIIYYLRFIYKWGEQKSVALSEKKD